MAHPFNGCIQQAHVHELLATRNELPIVVKDHRGHRHVVKISSFRLAEFHVSNIEMRHHTEFRSILPAEIVRLVLSSITPAGEHMASGTWNFDLLGRRSIAGAGGPDRTMVPLAQAC